MSEVQRIRGQFKAVCVGPAWHGAPLSDNLKDISAEQAARHPIAGAHSIWELVLHIAAWERQVKRVLEGAPHATLQGDHDWPPVTEASEQAWQAVLGELRAGHLALRAAMKLVAEDDLDKPVPGGDYSLYVLLHGISHHSLYHSGQIALLKKAVS